MARITKGEEDYGGELAFIRTFTCGYSPSMKCVWMAQDRGACGEEMVRSSMLPIFATLRLHFEEVKALSFGTRLPHWSGCP
ncbi:hypothetical protein H5410_032006 [Solanum commersonii]|uniref:Uncharacterized protein n=1 Tax=Solanum commersonii TaxID=4109 RepID=A0A9J5YND6_SOLCO|nr:hypothetical protein H5410_032006 [Solanum commersonii]